MIVLTAYSLNEPHTPRDQRIEAAEDRAEQTAYEVGRERGV